MTCGGLQKWYKHMENLKTKTSSFLTATLKVLEEPIGPEGCGTGRGSIGVAASDCTSEEVQLRDRDVRKNIAALPVLDWNSPGRAGIQIIKFTPGGKSGGGNGRTKGMESRL